MTTEQHHGENLAAIRRNAGMTQAQTADLAGDGFNERLVARIETGMRPMRYSEAVTLASVFGVPVGAFAGADEGTLEPTLSALAAENRRLRSQQSRIRQVLNDTDPRGMDAMRDAINKLDPFNNDREGN